MPPIRPLIFWKAAARTLLIAAALAAPALAQSQDDGDWVRGRRLPMDYRAAREMVMAGRDYAVEAGKQKSSVPQQPDSKNGGYIYETLIGMQDAMSVGEKIAHFIWRTPTVSVEFGKTKSMSEVHTDISKDPKATVSHTIVIDETLARYPRVLSIAIARAAFRVMHSGMVDCAEKRYMEASTVARVYVELGGSLSSLPAIEPITGYKNPEMEEILRSWLGKPSLEAIREIAAATKTPRLETLLSANASELKDLEKIEAEFEEEMHWSHHPDPAYEKTLIRLYQVRATRVELEHTERRYTDFMMGEHDRDTTGERLWDLMHPGHHPAH